MKIFGKVELKIPSKQPDTAAQLSELRDSLRGFLSAVDHGDWDQICANPEAVLSAFEKAQRPEFLGTMTSNDSVKIQEAITLLQAAIEKCAERQEQIAPLLKALIPFKDTPDIA